MKPKLCVLLLISFSIACAQNPVPISQEPHHRLVLQNQYTQVYDVAIPPHASTLMFHQEHDYVVVIVTPSDVQNEIAGKPITGTGHAGVGEVRFASAPVTHRLINKGDTVARSVTIEILNPKPPRANEAKPERGLDVGHGGLTDIVVDNSEVRVQEVQIAPGGMLHKHTHKFPFLVVALGDLDLHNMPQGKPATEVRQKAGEVKWIGPGSTHEMMNVGNQEAHFVEVEFK